MSVHDLNIENYSLEDILGLFKLDFDFTGDDLRQAKKVVLQTHPDKTGKATSKEQFLFFAQAYRLLLEVYQFRNRSLQGGSQLTEYKILSEEHERSQESRNAIWRQFQTADGRIDTKKFNKVFNELFEQHNTVKPQDGYGAWLKGDEGLLPENHQTSLNQMHDHINARKRELKAIMVQRDPMALYASGNGGTELHQTTATYYDSDQVFQNGGLQGNDLQRVYQHENVVPVTHEDFLARPQYKTEEDLVRDRAVGCIPLSEPEAKQRLRTAQEADQTDATQRAFALAKQIERSQKANQSFISAFQALSFGR